MLKHEPMHEIQARDGARAAEKRRKSQEQLAKVKQRDADALREREKAQAADAAKTVRLRTLRLAKEAADKSAAEQAAAEKAAAKAKPQAKTSKPKAAAKSKVIAAEVE